MFGSCLYFEYEIPRVEYLVLILMLFHKDNCNNGACDPCNAYIQLALLSIRLQLSELSRNVWSRAGESIMSIRSDNRHFTYTAWLGTRVNEKYRIFHTLRCRL